LPERSSGLKMKKNDRVSPTYLHVDGMQKG
jgi:hypothetical protein